MTLPNVPEPPEPFRRLEPGAVLAGRYRLVRFIGEGGMSSVWEGRQITTDKPVAIKLLKGGDDAHAARLLREAKLVAGLAHRNIVQVFDFWEADGGGPVFMVMELLRGETLGAQLDHRGSLTVDETRAIAIQVASAVHTAHAASVIHRDLKPENIVLVPIPASEGFDVKVLDFGIAKPLATDTAITYSGAVLGTPCYMAPEQVRGENDVDARADVWALGIILYECLAGQRPFAGENVGQVFHRISQGGARPLRELAPATPVPMLDLVEEMLSHDRAKRPSMLAVHERLLRPAGGRTRIHAAEAPTLPVLPPPPRELRAPARQVASTISATSAPPPPYELQTAAPTRPTHWVALTVAAIALLGAAAVWGVSHLARPVPRVAAGVEVGPSGASTSSSAAPKPLPSTAATTTTAAPPDVDAAAGAPASSTARPRQRPRPATGPVDPLGRGRF